MRLLLVSIAFSVACLAQHLNASSAYANGSTSKFTLTNFDNANSGGGNVYEFNGLPVSIYVEWTRDANGNVAVNINGSLSATLKTAAQNSQGGKSTLNSSPASDGTWTRR
jgi:hypothetical protein